jgi:hypothetical protein
MGLTGMGLTGRRTRANGVPVGGAGLSFLVMHLLLLGCSGGVQPKGRSLASVEPILLDVWLKGSPSTVDEVTGQYAVYARLSIPFTTIDGCILGQSTQGRVNNIKFLDRYLGEAYASEFSDTVDSCDDPFFGNTLSNFSRPDAMGPFAGTVDHVEISDQSATLAMDIASLLSPRTYRFVPEGTTALHAGGIARVQWSHASDKLAGEGGGLAFGFRQPKNGATIEEVIARTGASQGFAVDSTRVRVDGDVVSFVVPTNMPPGPAILDVGGTIWPEIVSCTGAAVCRASMDLSLGVAARIEVVP